MKLLFNLKLEVFSFCRKIIHSVSTCYRRLIMLKKSKPQSKILTPFFYQHFKIPSSKDNNLTPRYRSRSNSNHYRKFSRECQYKPRSHSRSNSRSKYYHIHPS